MKKNSLSGFKDVFAFTLVQVLKSKAFIISSVIILALTFVSMPIISMISSGGKADVNGPSPVKKVYINNETTLPNMNFKELNKDERFSGITFEELKEDSNVVSKRIENQERDSVLLTLKENEGNYSLDFVKASSGPIKQSSLDLLSKAVSSQFDIDKMSALKITDKQLAMIYTKVNTKVIITDVNGNTVVEKNTSISSSQYWFVYGILFFVMMVNIIASTQIATSIVTEKSTRVIEYLLISVRPLAIMAGKILAMLLAALLQMASLVAVLIISNKISAKFSFSNGESALSQYLPMSIFQNINIFNLLLCLVLIVLGMTFYATLAGLAGATVSRIEELSEGLTLFTFTNLIGVYVGMAAAGMLMGKGVNGFVIFSFLFPLSSPFLMPGAILIGKATFPLAAASIALQVIFIILLIKFVARVYETLILHNGNKIKVKELIKLSKTV